MIPLSWQILLALLLDALCGDPRWVPHPVKGIGWLARSVENPLRKALPERQAGIAAGIAVIAGTVGCGLLIQQLCALVHPLLADFVSIILLYTCFAMQDLRRHALAVYEPLQVGDLEGARKRVAWLVGRDTADLDEGEITRATVESVAENTVDGVTAPLFYALVAGLPGALFYKAVNTLDSTFGYKNERYLHFGWAPARFDDLVNFVPARLTALLVPIAAAVCGYDWRGSWRIFRRDRHQHPSPNGGQIEAAMAGGLGVRLGGENSYFGKKSFRPYMGDAKQPLQAKHIRKTVRLMIVTTSAVAILGLLVRWLWVA